jgi:hypothetical protein
VSSHVVTPNTEAAILALVVESDPSAITPHVARYLLSMQFPPADEERVNELSPKARAGFLRGGRCGSCYLTAFSNASRMNRW